MPALVFRKYPPRKVHDIAGLAREDEDVVPSGHVRHWVSLEVILCVGQYFPFPHWKQVAVLVMPSPVA